jgi:hypothetical protein
MFQEASNGLCHEKFSRMSVGDIEGQSDNLPPSSVQLVRRRHRFVAVSVCDDHLPTDLRQFTGDAETKPWAAPVTSATSPSCLCPPSGSKEDVFVTEVPTVRC